MAMVLVDFSEAWWILIGFVVVDGSLIAVVVTMRFFYFLFFLVVGYGCHGGGRGG